MRKLEAFWSNEKELGSAVGPRKHWKGGCWDEKRAISWLEAAVCDCWMFSSSSCVFSSSSVLLESLAL